MVCFKCKILCCSRKYTGSCRGVHYENSRMCCMPYYRRYKTYRTNISESLRFSGNHYQGWQGNDEYLKKCIIQPNVDNVKGYPTTLMQSYRSTLSDDDIAKIIEYFKTLND